MTDELTKAAENASDALGMSVEANPYGESDTLYQVEVWTGPTAPHGEDLVDSFGFLTAPAALAYLRGLETGARIQRERYAEVVSAVHAMFSDMDAGYSPARGDCAVDRLAKALSELEG